MARAEMLAGQPLDAVVAGLHLTAPSAGTVADAETVRLFAREFASLGTRFYTFHCTGLDAYGILRDELGLSAIWAGYYEGNERSHRVQEKLGFEFRYRRECDVELLGERRVECCQLLVPERVR